MYVMTLDTTPTAYILICSN